MPSHCGEQRAPGLLFGKVAFGLDIFDREVGRTALDVELGDHPVGIERDVVLEHRGMCVVGHGTEEGAVDLGRDLAFDLEVADGNLHSPGHVAANEVDGLRKGVHGILLSGDSGVD